MRQTETCFRAVEGLAERSAGKYRPYCSPAFLIAKFFLEISSDSLFVTHQPHVVIDLTAIQWEATMFNLIAKAKEAGYQFWISASKVLTVTTGTEMGLTIIKTVTDINPACWWRS